MFLDLQSVSLPDTLHTSRLSFFFEVGVSGLDRWVGTAAFLWWTAGLALLISLPSTQARKVDFSILVVPLHPWSGLVSSSFRLKGGKKQPVNLPRFKEKTSVACSSESGR